jgi:hypothetical protein
MQEKSTKFVRLTGTVNLKIRTPCSFGADVFPITFDVIDTFL